jgi:hypothetical protein
MTPAEITAAVDAYDARVGRSTPTARKTGRNPKWPYVPVLILSGGQQQQIRGLAYATRPEAIAAAERHIAAIRRRVERDLADPACRALREHYGLPREIR